MSQTILNSPKTNQPTKGNLNSEENEDKKIEELNEQINHIKELNWKYFDLFGFIFQKQD